MTWKPRPRAGVDHLALPLDPRQGYLLSLLDGALDVPTLAALMNLGEDEVTSLLDDLVRMGAVASLNQAPAARPAMEADPEPVPAPEATVDPEATDPTEEDPLAAGRATTHRQLFELHLHGRPQDERVAQAKVAVEPDLCAWCFDPTAEVIRAVLENPRVGGLHARLIAAHHRTTAGLEALGGRPAFTQDGGVRRALLQNPLLPPGLYRRLWSTRRLLDQYLVAISREAPEQVRAMARDVLRASFTQRAGEERAELILSTEGRCLASLVGLTIDSHATAILCRRTYTSTLLVQNIARWSAAPPQLIAHLRRQDLVKRNPVLRQMLERHPNAS
ncbi:MAG: hypothetical protein HXX12_16100 [Geothrix sp.]|uniref:hypothetical protein n=1 Tax=Geothrix sp. TaxID=1962974 RepID=UPI0017D9B28E|nr:hypothetical protein [Geothrix sp.]NWJ42484.1 hypothetical protein [Geothrix sp.]WIL19553.1 MAG: hypothetical protein QOZ81_002075 [Geothrix sp.]